MLNRLRVIQRTKRVTVKPKVGVYLAHSFLKVWGPTLVNIFAMGLIWFLGYQYIEKAKLEYAEITKNKEQVEMLGLQSKLISDIRPKVLVLIERDSKKKYVTNLGLTLKIKNNGTHHVFISDLSFELTTNLVRTKKGALITKDYLGHDTLLETTGQGIPPSGEQEVDLRLFYDEPVKPVQIQGNYKITVVTDPVLVDEVISNFPKKFRPKRLSEITTFQYNIPISFAN